MGKIKCSPYRAIWCHLGNLGLKLSQEHCITRFDPNIRVQLNQYVTPTFWGQSRLDPVIFGLSFIFILDTHIFSRYISLLPCMSIPFGWNWYIVTELIQWTQELFIQYFWVRISLTQMFDPGLDPNF